MALVSRQLVLVLETTAHMQPHIKELRELYIDPLIRTFADHSAQKKERVDFVLVLFRGYAPSSGYLVRVGGAVRDAKQLLGWLDQVQYTTGGYHAVATADALAAAFHVSTSERLPAKERHFLLITNSSPHAVPARYYAPMPQAPLLSHGDMAAQLAKAGISLSIIAPRNLPELTELYNKGNAAGAPPTAPKPDGGHLVLLRGLKIATGTVPTTPTAAPVAAAAASPSMPSGAPIVGASPAVAAVASARPLPMGGMPVGAPNLMGAAMAARGKQPITMPQTGGPQQVGAGSTIVMAGGMPGQVPPAKRLKVEGNVGPTAMPATGTGVTSAASKPPTTVLDLTGSGGAIPTLASTGPPPPQPQAPPPGQIQGQVPMMGGLTLSSQAAAAPVPAASPTGAPAGTSMTTTPSNKMQKPMWEGSLAWHNNNVLSPLCTLAAYPRSVPNKQPTDPSLYGVKEWPGQLVVSGVCSSKDAVHQHYKSSLVLHLEVLKKMPVPTNPSSPGHQASGQLPYDGFISQLTNHSWAAVVNLPKKTLLIVPHRESMLGLLTPTKLQLTPRPTTSPSGPPGMMPMPMNTMGISMAPSGAGGPTPGGTPLVSSGGGTIQAVRAGFQQPQQPQPQVVGLQPQQHYGVQHPGSGGGPSGGPYAAAGYDASAMHQQQLQQQQQTGGGFYGVPQQQQPGVVNPLMAQQQQQPGRK